MGRISSLLDFNLQKYSERSALVAFLDEQGMLRGAPPSELDKVANYLLYAEDVGGAGEVDVELKESNNKKKISYEELIESTLGEATIARREEVSVYRVPRPTIDRSEKGTDKDIPGMRDLWEAIDIIDERYRYCKNVLEGKQEPNLERELVPTYQTKYFMREWMISLRREQFLLRDIWRPVIGVAAMVPGHAQKPQYVGMAIGPHILCDCPNNIDFGNWEHIYNLLKYYDGMKITIGNNPFHEWWVVYEFLDELMRRVRWTPEQKIILERKIARVPNEEIVRELEETGFRSYSVNYISTIFKQHISKRIVKYAYLWWEEHTHEPDGTLDNMMRWKICPECGRQLYLDELNFGQTMDGTWRDVCKDCTWKSKKEKMGVE